MCKYLTEVVNSKFDRKVTLHETVRNLLSVAFKNVVGGLRSSIRTLENAANTSIDAELKESYTKIVQHELENKCLEVLKLLELKLIPPCKEELKKNG